MALINTVSDRLSNGLTYLIVSGKITLAEIGEYTPMTFTSEDLLKDILNTIITNLEMECLIAIKSALPIPVATPHEYHYLNGAENCNPNTCALLTKAPTSFIVRCEKAAGNKYYRFDSPTACIEWLTHTGIHMIHKVIRDNAPQKFAFDVDGSYDDVMAMPFKNYEYVAITSEYGRRCCVIAITLTAAIQLFITNLHNEELCANCRLVQFQQNVILLDFAGL